MTTQTPERFDTVVIGGGQAGLAAGYFLAQQDEPFVIVDAHERIGDSWRGRWPSLELYSPAKYDGLPGMPYPAPRGSFPTSHEMADYLEAYAERFALPVRSGVRVDTLASDGERYVVTTGERRLEADNVIVATGVMQVPVVPELASELDPAITQLHSAEYRSPSQLREGPVLVVGAAHSGGDIAYELAGEHETVLCGPDTGQLPFSVDSRRGALAFPVLRFLWCHVMTVNTPIGRKLKTKLRSHGGPLLRVRSGDLKAAGVQRTTCRVADVEGGLPVLDDGRAMDVANVVWCTGFRPDYSWIDLPLEYEGAYPTQYRGAVASHPGLYFVGMLFLHSFASMLILGAVRDARQVAAQIAARRRAAETAQARRERTVAVERSAA
jgi:putative flavoprotein involved in K+ transport